MIARVRATETSAATYLISKDTSDDRIYRSTLKLAGRIHAKKPSCMELTKLPIARIDAANPKINAVVTRLLMRAQISENGRLRNTAWQQGCSCAPVLRL
jgi:Asp-tRNA(Asn)/Glu-tRNA(Gln) amidotransferase A subunit family amidase